jgi:hypothetical protein
MSPFPRPSIDSALCSIATSNAGQATRRFQARIKKLLDLDRTFSAEATRGSPRAFTDHAGLKQGVDASYTHFNAFSLALGLELLEAGFKQSEVVLWLRLTRPWIEAEYAQILSGHFRENFSNDAPIPLPNTRQRCYMSVEHLITPEDLPELKLQSKVTKGKDTPLAIVPKFFEGTDQLGAAIGRAPSDVRRWLIIECRTLAVRLHNALIETAKN